MKKLLATICVLFLSLAGYSQWSIVNIGTTQDLYSVDYYSTNDIWIGSFNQIIKSGNGGANWTTMYPIKDPSNVQILPANMNDLALTGSNSAIGTGLFFTGNNECILTTANGGSNWTIATNNNTVPLLRYINTVDINGTCVVAVGNNGRAFTSSNSGASFSLVNTGTTKQLNDVKFASQDTVFAVGENVILKSVNRGATWSAINSYTASFNQVSCIRNTIYIGTSYNNQLFKSTDYGVTYTPINLPFTATGVIHAVSKDTVLAAASDGLYVSVTGGQYWEKYNLSGYKQIKMIDKLGNSLYAVGNTGYVIKTGNISVAPSLPIAKFTVQGATNICLNDSISFLNNTPQISGYAYDWKINGVTFSNQYNTGKKFTTAGTFTVTLNVTNGFGTSNYSAVINVTGHSSFSHTVFSVDDTVCVNSLVGFYIPNSESNTNYRVRQGFQNIGIQFLGNGSTLSLPAQTLTNTTTFNIKATKSNGCYIDSNIVTKTIFVNTGAEPTNIYTSENYCTSNPSDQPGIKNVSFNGLSNSTSVYVNNYFDYSCCKGTTVNMGSTYTLSVNTNYSYGEYVKVWIDYNNNGQYEIPNEIAFSGYSGFGNYLTTGTITIDTTNFFYQKLRMRIASDISSSALYNGTSAFNCGQVEDYYLIIEPSAVVPVSNFSVTLTQSCTTTALCNNLTVNATSFAWDFGDGSPIITTKNANHTYGAAGVYTISLSACNPTGCNTSTKTFTNVVPAAPIPAVCNPTLTNYCSDIPTINQFFQFQNGVGSGTSLQMNIHDYSCTEEFHLIKDSAYTNFHIITNGKPGYLAGYADFNNDGVFTPVTETIFGGTGQNYVMGSQYSGNIGLWIPNMGIDSIPLRMRLAVNTSFLFNVCSDVVCGDYKDFKLYLYPHKLQTFFSVTSSSVCAPTSSVSVAFTNTSKGANTYLWDFGDGTTSTAFEPTHVYNSYGTYTVKLKTGNGLTADSLIKNNYIVFNQGYATPTIVATGSILSTTANANAYQWFKNGTVISGATTNTYNATQDGNYFLQLTSPNGCAVTSNTIAYFPVHLSLDLSTDTICIKEYVYANHTRVNATTLWLRWGEGVNDLNNWNGTGGPIHAYSAPGTYTVFYKGCGSYNCDSLTKIITVLSGQDTGIVVLNGGVLSTTTTANQYQWYLNNSLIVGATSFSYAPTQDGYYQVKLSNANNCSSMSKYFIYYPARISYSADTTGYCGVSTAQVQFSNTSQNGINYLWDFGDGTTSSVAQPAHTYTANGIYTVKLKVCSSYNGCDSVIKTNYITVTNTLFTPNIMASSSTPVCWGDTIVLSCTNVSSGKFKWFDTSGSLWNDTLSSYKATYGSDFYALVSNSVGCSAFSNTITPSIENECVWPGDADNSYQVDNYDLLTLGINYNQTGIARTYTSNVWQQNPVSNWGTIQTGGWADLKHADCNGDGIINDDDTLAIIQNFSLSHSKNVGQSLPLISQSDPTMDLVATGATYYPGDWVDVDLVLGTAAVPVINFYGTAFSVWYDGINVEPGTMSITYPNSWINVNGVNKLSLSKNFDNTNTVYGAITKTNQNNSSGYGTIAKLRFQVNTQLTDIASLYMYINSIYLIDSTNTPQAVNYGADVVIPIEILSTSISEKKNDYLFTVSPNPFLDKTIVSYSLKKQSHVKIELVNIIGEIVILSEEENQESGIHKFELSSKLDKLSKGVYVIKCYIDNDVYSKKLIKQ